MFRPLLMSVSILALAFAVQGRAFAVDSAAAPPTTSGDASTTQVPEASEATVSDTQKRVQDKEVEKRKLITAEAMAAVNETRTALKALDDGNKNDALSALERATGKLDIILARDPNLVLAPTSVTEQTTAILADEAKIKELRQSAESLLASGQVQLARHVLAGLASETVISVRSIPLGTYPGALKQAARLVDQDKPEEAKRALQTALNTLVVTNTVVPLPIVAIQTFLGDAERLAEKPSRSVNENQALSDDLSGARKELAYAEALGYGTKADFENINDQLSEIASKTEDGKSGTGFFTKIKSFLSAVVAYGQSADAKQPAPQPHG